jgi:hypothetical protein
MVDAAPSALELTLLVNSSRRAIDDAAPSALRMRTAATLLYTYSGDKLGRITGGTTDRDRLVAVASDFCVVQAIDGKTRKYLRIR